MSTTADLDPSSTNTETLAPLPTFTPPTFIGHVFDPIATHVGDDDGCQSRNSPRPAQSTMSAR
jgi:hypothetical protein